MIVLEISVAALMTTQWVARKLKGPVNADLLVLPGYCRGDIEQVRTVAGISVERGPKDLRGLPRWFLSGQDGPAEKPADYGSHSIEIIAEINHAPQLPADTILETARRFSSNGADVIDLGCNPGETWNGLGDSVKMLREEGFRVAVDTVNAEEIRAGADAGAELVLSVHSANLDVARDLTECEVVAIPDDPKTLAGLDTTIERLEEWKVPYRIDPIIEPIGFGFSASLGRYIETRRRYPETAMLMGIGNLTELTDVDTSGVNAMLIGFCEELSIGSVLTTEVIHWAQTAVKEVDIARKLMHYAVSHGVLPKHLDTDLICLRDAELLEHGQEVLDGLAEQLKDPNFRIFAERDQIHVMNRDGYCRGTDPFELFEKLTVNDPGHAFYLGFEMAKAVISLRLGKQYHQDRALTWGFLTLEEASHLERKRKEARDDTPGETE